MLNQDQKTEFDALLPGQSTDAGAAGARVDVLHQRRAQFRAVRAPEFGAMRAVGGLEVKITIEGGEVG